MVGTAALRGRMAWGAVVRGEVQLVADKGVEGEGPLPPLLQSERPVLRRSRSRVLHQSDRASRRAQGQSRAAACPKSAKAVLLFPLGSTRNKLRCNVNVSLGGTACVNGENIWSLCARLALGYVRDMVPLK